MFKLTLPQIKGRISSVVLGETVEFYLPRESQRSLSSTIGSGNVTIGQVGAPIYYSSTGNLSQSLTLSYSEVYGVSETPFDLRAYLSGLGYSWYEQTPHQFIKPIQYLEKFFLGLVLPFRGGRFSANEIILYTPIESFRCLVSSVSVDRIGNPYWFDFSVPISGTSFSGETGRTSKELIYHTIVVNLSVDIPLSANLTAERVLASGVFGNG